MLKSGGMEKPKTEVVDVSEQNKSTDKEGPKSILELGNISASSYHLKSTR